MCVFFFFFQAEDGIRDSSVTGVQTCALPIYGPFAILVAHHGEMIGLTDRIKLRPLVAGSRGDFLYMSSEEAAMRLVSPTLDRFWAPRGGEPVIGRLRNPAAVEALTSVRA